MMTWDDILRDEMQQPYFQQLLAAVQQERDNGQVVYPAPDDVFNAFAYAPLERVKVVILGQDPYHNEQQAHGLAFSVQQGCAVPSSLINIYKELASDLPDFKQPAHGCLTYWAEQGVLLLNTVLTVRAHQANSHAKLGWERFTDFVVAQLNQRAEHLVFMLWGSHAQKKGANINRNQHLVLTAPHPSPLSAYRGFFGCRHFSQANDYLQQHGIAPIDWQI
ncbi:uracil-DNA glycosylase [Kingella kingae]|uniref:uracil-DNA glycosylase n=1 Tax=Kingella kingae TaxID=504 RepID=UPI0002F7F6CE|nr:uracil-DNA glycosylase [Kingella kingae]MBD3614370.1 uracil-DNA glycosylase [Kingella kingae]MBD3632638.1 uracil-DNA glycosylase [Kingella kingae]MBD3660031.1 uracil-DNA glycosylase [Kingella kingae]MDK4568147.1 uracil-DNA glycosylase [Kingella kingae]MDK4570103.1 uracil-DNA glycosylase [Kingella kingae]